MERTKRLHFRSLLDTNAKYYKNIVYSPSDDNEVHYSIKIHVDKHRKFKPSNKTIEYRIDPTKDYKEEDMLYTINKAEKDLEETEKFFYDNGPGKRFVIKNENQKGKLVIISAVTVTNNTQLKNFFEVGVTSLTPFNKYNNAYMVTLDINGWSIEIDEDYLNKCLEENIKKALMYTQMQRDAFKYCLKAIEKFYHVIDDIIKHKPLYSIYNANRTKMEMEVDDVIFISGNFDCLGGDMTRMRGEMIDLIYSHIKNKIPKIEEKLMIV